MGLPILYKAMLTICNTLAKDDMHPKDGSWDLNKSALNWYLK